MLAELGTRRNFAARLASLFTGAGVLGLASNSAASAHDCPSKFLLAGMIAASARCYPYVLSGGKCFPC